MWTSKEKLA